VISAIKLSSDTTETLLNLYLRLFFSATTLSKFSRMSIYLLRVSYFFFCFISESFYASTSSSCFISFFH